MKSRFVSTILLPTAISFVAMTASAGRIKASCYIDPSGSVKGSNTDGMTEIASVSKLLTTHWAISKVGPMAKIKTLVHVTPVAGGGADVHLQGGLDPSFNKSRFAVIAGHLNSLGITSVRNLTFDENFRYRDAIYSGPQVAKDPVAFIDKKDDLTPQLRAVVANIASTYQTTRADNSLSSSDLPNSVSLKVADIHYLNSSEFKKTAETATYKSESIPVYKILKQMNIKSNNYIANIIFDYLGGEEAFKKFMAEKMNFTRAQVDFGNGSGYPIRPHRGQSRFDNRATCRSIVTIARDLRNQMIAKDMKFADVVAVAGDDAGSTVNIYNNDLTEGALAAKTGTIDPVVALAGLASSVQGNIYFAVVVADGRPGTPARSGRAIIGQEVANIFKAYGGSDEMEYSASSFFSVDDNGKLQKEATAGLQ